MDGKKILIIDDDYNSSKALKATLEEVGYLVFYACNRQEGLNKLKEVGPDLILLDLVLPGESGFKIAQDIKANPDYTNIPIIAISLKKEEIDKHIAARVGIISYIEKPIPTSQLLFCIKDILNNK